VRRLGLTWSRPGVITKAMSPLLLTALLLTAGGTPALDPLTEAADSNEREDIRKALFAVAQKRSTDFSLEDNKGIANERIISQSGKWLHVDWQFVEHDAVSKLGVSLSGTPSDGEALATCKQSGGKRALVGTVVAATPGSSDLVPGMVPAHASVDLHLLDCQTGTTLARIDEAFGDITTLDTDPANAGVKALRIAATRVADEVQTKVLDALP
jgi:hypothetical protein